jgi:hypothetical protein
VADRLPELLEAALAGETATAEPGPGQTPTQLLGELEREGRDRREATSVFAELVSGSSRRSGTRYRTARRNVERWTGGRQPRDVPRLRRAVQGSRLRRELGERGANIQFRVLWGSPKHPNRKPEWLPAGRSQAIPRDVMRGILRTARAGSIEGAAEDLRREFLERYGVPHIENWLRSVDVHGLRISPA